MSTIALHSTLNTSETVRDRGLVPNGPPCPPIGNGLWGIKWSRDRWSHVTLKGQTSDLNTLGAQYLENSWRVLSNNRYYYLVCCESVRSAILATAWFLVILKSQHKGDIHKIIVYSKRIALPLVKPMLWQGRSKSVALLDSQRFEWFPVSVSLNIVTTCMSLSLLFLKLAN